MPRYFIEFSFTIHDDNGKIADRITRVPVEASSPESASDVVSAALIALLQPNADPPVVHEQTLGDPFLPIMPIPKPPSVTLTVEQYRQLLASAPHPMLTEKQREQLRRARQEALQPLREAAGLEPTQEEPLAGEEPPSLIPWERP